MQPSPSFGFDQIVTEQIRGLFEAVTERPGLSAERRGTLKQSVVCTVMAYNPRDPLEAMMAGQTLVYDQLMRDGARDLFRGQTEPLKLRNRPGIIACGKIFLQTVEALAVLQTRAAQSLVFARPPEEAVSDAADSRGDAAAEQAWDGGPPPRREAGPEVRPPAVAESGVGEIAPGEGSSGEMVPGQGAPAAPDRVASARAASSVAAQVAPDRVALARAASGEAAPAQRAPAHGVSMAGQSSAVQGGEATFGQAAEPAPHLLATAAQVAAASQSGRGSSAPASSATASSARPQSVPSSSASGLMAAARSAAASSAPRVAAAAQLSPRLGEGSPGGVAVRSTSDSAIRGPAIGGSENAGSSGQRPNPGQAPPGQTFAVAGAPQRMSQAEVEALLLETLDPIHRTELLAAAGKMARGPG